MTHFLVYVHQIVGREVFDAAKGGDGLRAVLEAVDKAKDRAQQGDSTLRGDEWV